MRKALPMGSDIPAQQPGPGNVLALVVPADGEGPARLVVLVPSLPTLQRIVGGWLEAVEVGDGWHAYVDEEGKLKAATTNHRATKLASTLGWQRGHVLPIRPGYPRPDTLVGDAIFLGDGPDGAEGDVPEVVLETAVSLGIIETEEIP